MYSFVPKKFSVRKTHFPGIHEGPPHRRFHVTYPPYLAIFGKKNHKSSDLPNFFSDDLIYDAVSTAILKNGVFCSFFLEKNTPPFLPEGLCLFQKWAQTTTEISKRKKIKFMTFDSTTGKVS